MAAPSVGYMRVIQHTQMANRVGEPNRPPADIRAATPMKKNILFAALAWFQLAVSLLLAAAIIWGYMTFQASTGQFISALAASVRDVSTVVIRTAETVEARQDMLDDAQRLLVVTRRRITELKDISATQVKLAPQYATNLKSASSTVGTVATTLQVVGEKMTKISIPNIQMDGVKPVVSMTKPFEDQGKQLTDSAIQVKDFGLALAALSESIGQDGKKLGEVFIATSDQAIKVIDESEKTLARLKSQDLPKAIADLKATSENLRSVSTQIDLVGNMRWVTLVVGLLLAWWCIVQSVGTLLLAQSGAFGRETDKADARQSMHEIGVRE